MDFYKIINIMKETGVFFSQGLTNIEITKIEEIYEIRFPDSLRTFYSIALPISIKNTKFPKWNDFSPNNISYISQLIIAPYQWLKQDIDRGFWLSKWGRKTIDELLENAPKLIPIYSHRYVPMLNHADPPVISTVGRDTVYYGGSLKDYLFREFCDGNTAFEIMKMPYIPLWNDILECRQ